MVLKEETWSSEREGEDLAMTTYEKKKCARGLNKEGGKEDN